MNLTKWTEQIEENLSLALDKMSPEHQFKEVLSYSLLPAGKYFRPLLVYALAQDLEGSVNKDQQVLASSLEMHHTYTLIHDDLPSMDNDDYRRGRKSSHKKFSEWQAILAGDALMSLSFELIADLSANKVPTVLKAFTSMVGPKGLILGQVLDLGNENTSFEKLLKLHELKTGRLIQLALIGANILSEKPIKMKELELIGLYLGENFQLLDDLCELTEEVNSHEKEINPFFKFNTIEITQKIKSNNAEMKIILKKNELRNLEEYIATYLKKISKKLYSGLESINNTISLSEKDIEAFTKLSD